LRKSGESLALDAKALVVGQVPVEDVEFNRSHAVQSAIDDRQRHEMTAHIDHESAPGEAWRIVDLDGGNDVLATFNLQELLQGLETVQCSEDGLGMKNDLVVGRVQRVALVRVQRGTHAGRVLHLDSQSRVSRLRLFVQLDAGVRLQRIKCAARGLVED